MKRTFSLSILAALAIFGEGAKGGDLIQFDDSTETPQVLIDGIVSTNYFFMNETASCVGGFTSCTFISGTGNYQGTTGTYYRKLLDPPNDVDAGSVSDIFLITVQANSPVATFQFTSDPDTLMIPGGAINLGTVNESGNFQTVFTFTGKDPATGVISSDTYQVRSDVETVPEPSFLLLFSFGSLAVAIQHHLRSRSKRNV